LAVSSIGQSKRSGARVITLAKMEKKKVYLVSIYVKSKKSNITDQEIRNIIQSTFDE
jgi:hypothetical protein